MTREAFNSDKPYERIADRVRVEVSNLALRLMDDADYRSLNGYEQIETFMAGGITAIIGVCFASIESAGRDEMMKAIEEYLPLARENAEGIVRAALTGKETE